MKVQIGFAEPLPVHQLGAGVDLEDVDAEPARMERLYRRHDQPGRKFTGIEAVRCPICGRVRDWPEQRHRPYCLHDPEQRSFPTTKPRGGW